MKCEDCKLSGIQIIELDRYKDSRGSFYETYKEEEYIKLGMKTKFIQDNYSRSARNVLRGLHFTLKKPQIQLITLIQGEIIDVIVDIRKSSETFGKWASVKLSNDGPCQIYIPFGFAHGFYVISKFADISYKVSEYYDPNDDFGIKWNDPTLNISWPSTEPTLSVKDNSNKSFSFYLERNLLT